MNQLELMNAARTKLGRGLIQSLEDGSKEAEVFGNIWAPTKATALSSYTWSFAQFTFLLSKELAQPADPNWKNSFLLPADYLVAATAMDGNGLQTKYHLENNRLWRNSSRVILRYTRSVDESQMTAIFQDYLVVLLAFNGQQGLVSDSGLATRLSQELQDKYSLAVSRDAISRGPVEMITERSYTRAHFGGRR